MLKLICGDPFKKKYDVLVIPVCANRDVYEDQAILSLIDLARSFKEFSGETGEEFVLYNQAGVKTRRIFFVGLGKAGAICREGGRIVAGKIVKKCIDWNLAKVAVLAPDASMLKVEDDFLLGPMMEGAYLANYLFDSYLENKKKKKIKQMDFIVKALSAKRLAGLSDRVEKICEGTLIARDLVSTPSNDKTPEKMVEKIKKLFVGSDVGVSIFSEKQLEKLKFGAMLAVAKGSLNKPFFVMMDYNPGNTAKTIVLVGKGVTFDSGGLDLKAADGMAHMKMDMGGAATVVGTLHAMGYLKPNIRIIGVIPLVENMVSGDSYRPGDIIKSYNGKSIEVNNTDAEGRLILADALSWAEDEYQPDLMIDLATLTGACIVALGDKLAGVYSYHDRLGRAIVRSGERTGERCWQMPMPEDYKEMLKSDFADISNVAGSKSGGSITAALFLSEFVKGTRWAHIDIAGPVFSAKGNDYCPPGGTGFGVKLLCELLAGENGDLKI